MAALLRCVCVALVVASAQGRVLTETSPGGVLQAQGRVLTETSPEEVLQAEKAAQDQASDEAMQAEAAWQTRDQARRLTRHDQKPIAE